MFEPFCDFHTHTTCSDGRLAPAELVRKAYAAGIRVLSITDHNFTEDLSNLRKVIADEFEESMTLIQGVEISASYVDGNGIEHELHIVALGFDPNDPGIRALLSAHQSDREPYINAILKRLREDCEIDLGSYESILSQFPATKFIGRMALARLLMERGYTRSVDEGFDIYLGSHGERRAYVKNPFHYSSLDEVVKTILQAGGTPILAHLLYYDLDNGNRTGGKEKDRLVRTFKRIVEAHGGVGGIEVYYTRYKTMEERLYLLQMARKYGLLISAGSDYHEQETWETLNHRTSCSACSDLLEHLGVRINYQLPPAPLHVLSGFSGVGKGTICEALQRRKLQGHPIALIRSVTNRPPRSSNENYTFVSREEFSRLAEQNLLLEFNDAYAQNGYGTPVEAVKAALQNQQAILLEIDRVGLCHLLTDGKINPNLVKSVFIVADAVDVATRLYLRGTEDMPKICSRLKTAMKESFYLDMYDCVIRNDMVDDTVESVIDAFEGNPSENSFDPVKFRSDMEQVLTTYWRTPTGLLYDPVEDTAEYCEAMTQINQKLAEEFSDKALVIDYSPELWLRKKELLRSYGIHWRTPKEMNPDHHFT